MPNEFMCRLHGTLGNISVPERIEKDVAKRVSSPVSEHDSSCRAVWMGPFKDGAPFLEFLAPLWPNMGDVCLLVPGGNKVHRKFCWTPNSEVAIRKQDRHGSTKVGDDIED